MRVILSTIKQKNGSEPIKNSESYNVSKHQFKLGGFDILCCLNRLLCVIQSIFILGLPDDCDCMSFRIQIRRK